MFLGERLAVIPNQLIFRNYPHLWKNYSRGTPIIQAEIQDLQAFFYCVQKGTYLHPTVWFIVLINVSKTLAYQLKLCDLFIERLHTMKVCMYR